MPCSAEVSEKTRWERQTVGIRGTEVNAGNGGAAHPVLDFVPQAMDSEPEHLLR